jgi:hypothetical protein
MDVEADVPGPDGAVGSEAGVDWEATMGSTAGSWKR